MFREGEDIALCSIDFTLPFAVLFEDIPLA